MSSSETLDGRSSTSRVGESSSSPGDGAKGPTCGGERPGALKLCPLERLKVTDPLDVEELPKSDKRLGPALLEVCCRSLRPVGLPDRPLSSGPPRRPGLRGGLCVDRFKPSQPNVLCEEVEGDVLDRERWCLLTALGESGGKGLFATIE